MIPKRSVYFGTADRMSWIKAPAINIGRNRNRWQSSGTYLNGGGYILNSHYSHRMYTLSWNLMESDAVREIENYALGVYGPGPIHFLDPFVRNVLPLNWSVPFLTGDDAPPLVYDTMPDIMGSSMVAYTNLLTNPSFEATSGTVEVARNLLTNPSFETTSGTVEVRRNLCANPRPTAGWGVNAGTGGTAAVTYKTGDAEAPGGLYARATWSANATGAPDRGLESPNTTVTVGAHTLSVLVRPSVTQQIVARWAGTSATGTEQVFECPAGVWTRVSATVTVTVAGSLQFRVYAHGTGHAWQAGETLDSTALLYEASPALLPYFDHTFSPDPDLTPSATGTPNASPSILSGAGVAAVSGGSQRVIVSSTQWSASGPRSIRIIPTNWVAETAGANVYTFPAQDVGKTFTVLATARLAAPQTGTLAITARRIILLTPDVLGTQAPNEAGEHQLRWTFTVTTANQSLRLVNGAAIGGGDVWWDKVVLVEGVYNGPAFDGSSSGDPDLSAAWAGTANASTSFVTAPGVVGTSGALKIWKTSNGLKATVPGSPAAWRVGIAPGFPATNHTVLMRVRTTWTGYIRPSVGGPANGTGEALLPVTAGVWTTLRGLVIGGSNPTGVVGRSGDGYSLGDTVEIEYALVVAGDYAGPYFDGNTPNTTLNAYTWTGTPNASTTVLTAYPSVESNLPRQAAKYTLTAQSVPVELFVPVPPGEPFYFGAVGSRTGTAAITLTPMSGASVTPSLMANTTSAMTNTTIADAGGGVTISLTGAGTITLTAMTARISEPSTEGRFIVGEGNSGLRFADLPTITGYSSVMDLQAVGASLVEVGAWEPL